jgi:hypothetical protein
VLFSTFSLWHSSLNKIFEQFWLYTAKKRVLLRVVALLFGLGHRGGVRRSFARVLEAVKAMVVKL